MDKVVFIPLSLFFAFSTKCLIFGISNLFEVLFVSILALTSAFYQYKPKNKQIDQLNQKLDDIISKNDEKTKEMEELRLMVSSIKTASGFKNAQR